MVASAAKITTNCCWHGVYQEAYVVIDLQSCYHMHMFAISVIQQHRGLRRDANWMRAAFEGGPHIAYMLLVRLPVNTSQGTSGCQHSARTSIVCPNSNATHVPDCTSHTRAVASSLPLSSSPGSSGDHATLKERLLWPVRVCTRQLSPARLRSHTYTGPASLVVASWKVLLGCQARPDVEPVWRSTCSSIRAVEPSLCTVHSAHVIKVFHAQGCSQHM
jgi:hypothetical protein